MKQNKILSCKDHTVSNEIFDLIHDVKLDLLTTSPKPKNENLGRYYESDDYISHTDSNKSWIDKSYQIVKYFAIKRKIKLINSFKVQDKTILDIGCGTGDFLVACKKNGWKVFGVEPNKNARELTLHKLIEHNDSIQYEIKKNIEILFQNETEVRQYDVITLWHVLEHVPNLEEYINYLKKLLKYKGVLVIAVPNFNSYDANYYKEYWAAYDVPRHLSHFSKKSIGILFGNIGMRILKILPMKFDAYYVSLLSEKYKTGSMKPLKSLYRGFISNLSALRSKEYSSLIYIIKNGIKQL